MTRPYAFGRASSCAGPVRRLWVHPAGAGAVARAAYSRSMVAALSPSRASDFMSCPMLYRFRVIDKLPSPPTQATARGTLVHAVLERLFDLPAAERTIEAAVGLVPQEWERLADEEPAMLDLLAEHDGRTDEWFAGAATLLQTWFGLEDPTRLEPAERELYVETEFDGLVLWRQRGVIPKRLQLVYLGNGEIVAYEPDEQDLLGTERKVKALWQAIERAASTGDWRPSPSRLCDWCDHRALCPAWGGTPPPLPVDAAQRAVDPSVTGLVELED